MSLDPKQTGFFLAAVRAGSIRVAAEQIGVEPSTISRQITALEKQLSTILIERGRKGIMLTESGKLLEVYLQKDAANIESLQSKFDALHGMQRGTIHMSVGEGFAGDFFRNGLASFSKIYPEITYIIDYGSTEQIIQKILSDQTHVGLAFNVGRNRGVKEIATIKQPLKIIVNKSSKFVKLTQPVSLDEIKNLPCAVLDKGHALGETIKKVESRNGVKFNAKLETNSIASLKDFVREDMGVTFLPDLAVGRELNEKTLVALITDIDEFNQGEASLIVRQARQLPNSVAKFLTHVRRVMKN